MDATRHMTVGIRDQAAVIFALAAVWWLSLFHDPFFTCPNLFWIGIAYFCPFVLLIFQAILWISYLRAGRAHGWLWVLFALMATLSPWYLFLLVLVGAK